MQIVTLPPQVALLKKISDSPTVLSKTIVKNEKSSQNKFFPYWQRIKDQVVHFYRSHPLIHPK